MTDFYSHTARYHVMNHIDQSQYLHKYYRFKWILIANLGVDLLMVPLGAVFPTETAAKIAVSLIPFTYVMGIFCVARAAWGRVPASALVAVLMTTCMSFVFGFVNYHLSLSLALALLILALWIRTDTMRPAWRVPLFIVAGFGVWLSHMVGWGVLVVAAVAWETAKTARWQSGVRFTGNALAAAKAFGNALRTCAALLVPLLLTLLWRSDVKSAGTSIGNPFLIKPRKIAWLMRAEWQWLDLALTATICGLAGVLVYQGLRKGGRINRGLGLAAVFLAVLFAIMPKMVMGSDYADMRLLGPLFTFVFLGFAGHARHDMRLAVLAML